MKVTVSAWSWAFPVMMSSFAAHLDKKVERWIFFFLAQVPQNLGHAGEVHAHAEGPVATELVEAVSPQVDRHQRHVGVVHGL